MKWLVSPGGEKSSIGNRALVLSIAVLLAAGSGGWVVSSKIKRSLAVPPRKQQQRYVLSLGDPITVNLADSDHPAYLRCSVQLGLTEPMKGPEVLSSVSRDALIRIMAGQTSASLLSVQGREQARADLLRTVDAAGYPQVTEVYFSDFLVQR